jgi:hypothetical protein
MEVGFSCTGRAFEESRSSTLGAGRRDMAEAVLGRLSPFRDTTAFAVFFLETDDLRPVNDFFATLLAGFDIAFVLCLLFAAINQ